MPMPIDRPVLLVREKTGMASAGGRFVGIDLGTTFSAIATLDDRGQPVTLPNRDGEMLTPSAVFIDGDMAVVGQAALDVALEQPDKVATIIKRRIGHPLYGRLVSGAEISARNAIRHHPAKAGAGRRSVRVAR